MKWKIDGKAFCDTCHLSATKGINAIRSCQDECDDCPHAWCNGDSWCDKHDVQTPCIECEVVRANITVDHETVYCKQCAFRNQETGMCRHYSIETDDEDECDEGILCLKK